MKIKILLVSLLTLVLSSCSSVKESTEESRKPQELEKMESQELQLDIEKISAWINLMPNSENKFHISGELKVHDSYKLDLNFITIENVEINQGGQIIYTIKPVVQMDDELSDKTSKYIRFSTVRGLSRDPRLDINKKVDITIKLTDRNKDFSYFLENVAINKVY